MATQLIDEEARALADLCEFGEADLALLDELLDTDPEVGWRRIVGRAPAYIGTDQPAASSWIRALVERWEAMRHAIADNYSDPLLSNRSAATEHEDSSRRYGTVRTGPNGSTATVSVTWSGRIYRAGTELKVELSVDVSAARDGGVLAPLLPPTWRAFVELAPGQPPDLPLGPLYPELSDDRLLLEGILELPEAVTDALGANEGDLPAGLTRIRIEEA